VHDDAEAAQLGLHPPDRYADNATAHEAGLRKGDLLYMMTVRRPPRPFGGRFD
jgi:hypothetical protein